MKHFRACILVACLLAPAALAGGLEKGSISATETGKFQPAEKRVVALAFMAAVHNWLRRYEPELVGRDDYHVKMQLNYDYPFDVDLTVNADSYDVKVSLGTKRMTRTDSSTVQKDADKLAHGIRAHIEDELERSGRVK
jgi:hypothetical protein